MRSFDEVVDDLWKPRSYVYNKLTLDIYSEVVYKDMDKWNTAARNTIERKQQYAEKLMQPFYGRDVQEPIVKICKRILEKPNCFHLVKEIEHKENYCNEKFYSIAKVVSWGVVQDKDTQQKFVRKNTVGVVSNLSCLTYDEQVLLTAIFNEWYNHQKETIAQKKATREEKRNERFRKELSDLYGEY